MFLKVFNKVNNLSFKIRSLYYKILFRLPLTNRLRVYGKLVVKSPGKIKMGNNVAINDFVYLQADGEIEIGNNVVISAFAKIISTGLDTTNWNNEYQLIKDHKTNKVFINNGCWIGSGAIILPGVNINGENVIVAAGAVVTRDINESSCILAGIPAKVIKIL
ncbi:acyltransferase [Neobacillus drentensis]|uniref:acyltransferase n=1 Tax=Neobacillus drentensis TaxID=220684 RepID=UPI002FFEEB78